MVMRSLRFNEQLIYSLQQRGHIDRFFHKRARACRQRCLVLIRYPSYDNDRDERNLGPQTFIHLPTASPRQV